MSFNVPAADVLSILKSQVAPWLPSLSNYTSSISTKLEPVETWVKGNPPLAVITAVAFAILGIVMQIGALIMLAAAVQGVLLVFLSLASLASSAGLSYFLIKQYIATVKPQVEVLNDPPPNISTKIDDQKNYRKAVLTETFITLGKKYYHSPDGTLHSLGHDIAAQHVEVFKNESPIPMPSGNAIPNLIVKKEDFLYATAKLVASELKPIVLIAGSDKKFGGELQSGDLSHEADCCRRTGLAYALNPEYNVQKKNSYPPEQSSCLYVPSVPVFRGSYSNSYQYLNRPFPAVFGIFSTYSDAWWPSAKELEKDTTDKIRAFFNMAFQKGHQSVVVVPFSSTNLSLEKMAEITMQVIKKEFAQRFKQIVIAVDDDPKGEKFALFAQQARTIGGKAIDASGKELTSSVQ